LAEGDSTQSVVERVLKVLEPLLDGARGAVVRTRVEAILVQSERGHRAREAAYCRLLRDTLEMLAADMGRSQAEICRFIMETLEPPMTAEELRRIGVLVGALGSQGKGDSGSEAEATGPQAGEAVNDTGPEPADDSEPPSVTPIHSADRESEGQSLYELQGELRRRAQETFRRNEEAGELLESLITRLQLASELPEVIRGDADLTDEIRRIADAQQAVADRLQDTFSALQAVASDNTRLQAELQRVRTLSLTDEGTALPNRRALLRQLRAEIGRVQRDGGTFSLVLMDLDHFKAVNDRYGHGAGDEVLKTYASDVLSVFRAHDLVARYGGEEFAILLPATPQEGAHRAMVKIRTKLDEQRVRWDGIELKLPTFSAGIAQYRHGESAEELMQRADKALYRAKSEGRDRIEFDGDGSTEAGEPSHILESAASRRVVDRGEVR
jgi:diguanylate cyclase (GGDEF)-like protein